MVNIFNPYMPFNLNVKQVEVQLFVKILTKDVLAKKTLEIFNGNFMMHFSNYTNYINY